MNAEHQIPNKQIKTNYISAYYYILALNTSHLDYSIIVLAAQKSHQYLIIYRCVDKKKIKYS